jgi:copper chaperone CopZ
MTKPARSMKRVFFIHGMTCPNCAINIETIEDDLPGISSILVSYKKGEMEVEYEPLQVTEAMIKAEVERRGYQVE